MKISAYPQKQYVDTPSTTNMIIDEATGTRSVSVANFPYMLFDKIPEMHSQIFRGKNLGSTMSSKQRTAITSGSFRDLWLGDYWTYSAPKGPIKLRIADFNYWNPSADTAYNTSKPHIAVIAESPYQDSVLHGDNFFSAGINKLYITTTVLPNIKNTMLPAVFGGSYVGITVPRLNHDGIVNNHYSNPTVGVTSIMLPSEVMISGYNSRRFVANGDVGMQGFCPGQLALFKNSSYKLPAYSAGLWLSDMSYDFYFSLLQSDGSFSDGARTETHGIIPVFGIAG